MPGVGVGFGNVGHICSSGFPVWIQGPAHFLLMADSGIVTVDRMFGNSSLDHDHFRHLGHPRKLYRVQDAHFIDNSCRTQLILY